MSKGVTSAEFAAETGQDKEVPIRKMAAVAKTNAAKKTASKKSAPKKAAKAPSPKRKTIVAPKPAKKSKLGGARPGAGRPVEITGKVRQTIDFTGEHHKALKRLVKECGARGISPYIRDILDGQLPKLLKEAELPAMKK